MLQVFLLQKYNKLNKSNLVGQLLKTLISILSRVVRSLLRFSTQTACWQTYVVLFVEIYHILFWNMWENASIREAATTGRNIWEMLEYLRLAYENTENMCEMRREGKTVYCCNA